MAIFDVSRQLEQFFVNHVEFDRKSRKDLVEKKKLSLDRLSAGLRVLGEQRRQTYPQFVEVKDQGSFAMDTLIQVRKDNYDIDVAVIFERDALPTEALEARKRVADALIEAGGGFKSSPEARTNAVTVWYSQGYHVDLAIYRRVQGFFRPYLEHAGADWTKREPDVVTAWFARKVGELSPSGADTVQAGQLRRVTQLLKAFARSRDSWQLPGGMILTTLAAESYVPDRNRDDLSLYQTMIAIKARLDRDLRVKSPVDGSLLTSKPERQAEVRRFREKLALGLVELGVLEDDICQERDAFTAWRWLFRHPFWGSATDEVEAEDSPEATAVEEISIDVGLASAQRAPIRGVYAGPVHSLPKETWLRFTPSIPVGGDLKVRWRCRNTGPEARAARDEGWIKEGPELWNVARYHGIHSLTCEVVREKQVIARGIRRIRVGPK